MRSAYGKTPIFTNLSTVCFGHVHEENEDEENEDEFKAPSFKYFTHSNFESLKRIRRLKKIFEFRITKKTKEDFKH